MDRRQYCTKMETKIKLNFIMINLIFNVAVNVTRKWKKKIVIHLILLIFFSIYLGCVSYFMQNNIFYSWQYAPLILKIFNNKTDIILFLIRKFFFLSYALLFTISLLIFLNYICHLNYLLLFYFFHHQS